MVIADNDTRWNSTYLSIVRGLKLKTKLQYYSMDNRKELGADYLEEADWKVLEDVVECLEPFYICTLDLQSKAKQASHGAIWEALPAIEGILGHLEHLKATVPTSNKRLREAVMNSWAKLQEYYVLTDNSLSIYAAATLFHPPLRMKHFVRTWTGETAHWIPRMRAAVIKTWNDEYLVPAKAKEARSQLLDSEPPKKKQFTFRYWQQTHDPAKTEFENYADGTPDKDSKSFNGITWWAGMSGKDDFPTLFQYALDTLSCPAMSAECERVFSSAKKLITPERNQLGEDIIEACECLKAWWRNSLIEQQFGH
jgi:hypothetical protein